MRKYFIFFGIGILFLFSACSNTKDNPSQWRGPDRQGIFYETELLKSWPKNGPELLWSFEGIGAGHSSVGIGQDRVFVNGMTDTLGVLYSLDFIDSLYLSIKCVYYVRLVFAGLGENSFLLTVSPGLLVKS